MEKDEPTKVTCAFFSSPAPHAMIECLPSCLHVQGRSGARYPPINAGDFSRERSKLHAPGAKASGTHLIEDPRKKRQQQHH